MGVTLTWVSIEPPLLPLERDILGIRVDEVDVECENTVEEAEAIVEDLEASVEEVEAKQDEEEAFLLAWPFIWWRESSRSCAHTDQSLMEALSSPWVLPDHEGRIRACSERLLAPTPLSEGSRLLVTEWCDTRRWGGGWFRQWSERANLCLARNTRVGCSVSGSGGPRLPAPRRRLTSVSRASKNTPLGESLALVGVGGTKGGLSE